MVISTNRVTNYVGILQKFGEKNLKSMGWLFLICLAKEMQQINFYAYFHAWNLSYTDEATFISSLISFQSFTRNRQFSLSCGLFCCREVIIQSVVNANTFSNLVNIFLNVWFFNINCDAIAYWTINIDVFWPSPRNPVIHCKLLSTNACLLFLTFCLPSRETF